MKHLHHYETIQVRSDLTPGILCQLSMVDSHKEQVRIIETAALLWMGVHKEGHATENSPVNIILTAMRSIEG